MSVVINIGLICLVFWIVVTCVWVCCEAVDFLDRAWRSIRLAWANRPSVQARNRRNLIL